MPETLSLGYLRAPSRMYRASRYAQRRFEGDRTVAEIVFDFRPSPAGGWWGSVTAYRRDEEPHGVALGALPPGTRYLTIEQVEAQRRVSRRLEWLRFEVVQAHERGEHELEWQGRRFRWHLTKQAGRQYPYTAELEAPDGTKTLGWSWGPDGALSLAVFNLPATAVEEASVAEEANHEL